MSKCVALAGLSISILLAITLLTLMSCGDIWIFLACTPGFFLTIYTTFRCLNIAGLMDVRNANRGGDGND